LEGPDTPGYSLYLDGLDQTFFQVLTEGTKTVEKETETICGNPVIMFWRLKALKPGTTAVKIDS
jgi:hypothetical protein